MDVLADVIQQTRLDGVLFCQSRLDTSCGISFGGEPVAGFHIITQGQCWLVSEHLEAPHQMRAGDVVLVPRGTSHALVMDVHDHVVPWQTLEAVDATQIKPEETLFLCGAYLFDEAEYPHPVFSSLPDFVFVDAAQTTGSCPIQMTIGLLTAELHSQRQGSRALMERLVDALLIYILRCWLDEQPDASRGWLGALQDPELGPVLVQMHQADYWHRDMNDWSDSAHMSRATFARRFRHLVGQSPMAYVTRLRLSHAGRMLRKGHADLEEIAEAVGYATAFSFSKAFKRQYGLAPGLYRKQHQQHSPLVR